jgi:DUF438 domain-containing protein
MKELKQITAQSEGGMGVSGEINNREYRQQVIKELIEQLHGGAGVDQVKGRFEAVFDGVSAEEIAGAEQALIAGGLPVTEVQRLCDVHAAVFKGSIEEIHASGPQNIPGHPANTLKLENRAIETLAGEIRQQLMLASGAGAKEKLAARLRKLYEIDRHYLKKENLLFPYMEQYGITAPPKVMWGVDDEIRDELRAVVKDWEADAPGFRARVEALLGKVQEMVFKEENIMLPMLLENLTQDEWKRIADEETEFGYCLIDSPPAWEPAPQAVREAAKQAAASGAIILPTGAFTREELARVLNTLPIDITFVGADDTVRYFSENAERIFPRTKAVIGRKVSNCHPPASVHIVEQLVEDLRAGRKDHEDFWINMGGKYVLIRYFAVRGDSGECLGVLEVTQDIRPIQAITAEKRLVT